MNMQNYGSNPQGAGYSQNSYDPRFPGPGQPQSNTRVPQLRPPAFPPELYPPERVNLWLRIASATRLPQFTLKDRERARRNRLTAWILLGLFVLLLLLIPTTIGSPSTAEALAFAGVGFLVATFLNHRGWTTAAGILLVILIGSAILLSVTGENGGLEVVDLPAFDFFVITVIVGVSILPRLAAFIIAAVAIGLIAADFFLQVQSPGLLQVDQQIGPIALLARPIALLVIIAIVAFLWVRGVDQQVSRADRAEEMATLEHAYAEQRHQLEIGVHQILQTHVRIANGDYDAKAPLTQDNVLWQIAQSLNNLTARIKTTLVRANRAEYSLNRTNEEIARFAAALRDAQSGRRPIWPQPTGTSVDYLIQIVTHPAAISQQQDSARLPGGDPWSPTGSSVGPGPVPPSAFAQPGRQQQRPFQQPANNESPVTPAGGGQSYWDNFPGLSSTTPSYPPQQVDPQVSAHEQDWPSLDGDSSFFDTRNDGGMATQDQDPNAYPQNPWYLPPDE